MLLSLLSSLIRDDDIIRNIYFYTQMKKLKYIYFLAESCKEYEGNYYLLDSLHFKVSKKVLIISHVVASFLINTCTLYNVCCLMFIIHL